MSTEITYAVVSALSGVAFGNLLPFPKHVWEKVTLCVGVSLVGCVAWVIYKSV